MCAEHALRTFSAGRASGAQNGTSRAPESARRTVADLCAFDCGVTRPYPAIGATEDDKEDARSDAELVDPSVSRFDELDRALAVLPVGIDIVGDRRCAEVAVEGHGESHPEVVGHEIV